MTTLPVTSRIPVGAAVIAGFGAQFADDVAYLLFPPAALLAPLSAVLAVVLTAGAARLATRRLDGPVAARAGLAVGVVSAGLGLVVAGFGVLALLLAGLTVLAGVAGAVVGRRRAVGA